jgi:hypothetical protein
MSPVYQPAGSGAAAWAQVPQLASQASNAKVKPYPDRLCRFSKKSTKLTFQINYRTRIKPPAKTGAELPSNLHNPMPKNSFCSNNGMCQLFELASDNFVSKEAITDEFTPLECDLTKRIRWSERAGHTSHPKSSFGRNHCDSSGMPFGSGLLYVQHCGC